MRATKQIVVTPDVTRCQSWTPSWKTVRDVMDGTAEKMPHDEFLAGMIQCSNQPEMILEGPYGSGSVCSKHITEVRHQFPDAVLRPIEQNSRRTNE